MSLTLPTFARLLAFAAASSLASATTWTVAPAPGPGVDFTSISAAVTTAQAGDTIRVLAGNYSTFTLGKGLAIVAQGNVQVSGGMVVENVPAGARVAIDGVSATWIRVSNCAATVLLDDVATGYNSSGIGSVAYASVTASNDVRIRHAQIGTAAVDPSYPGMFVSTSRVELSECLVVGGNGISNGPSGYSAAGRPALICADGADVHVSSSSLYGGSGGSELTGSFNPLFAKSGAPAIQLLYSDTKLLVTGVASDTIRGGGAGVGVNCSYHGLPGAAVRIDSGSARLSGATFVSLANACGVTVPTIQNIGGTLVQPTPADPSLVLASGGGLGQPANFTVRGAPGAHAILRLGRTTNVTHLAGVFEDQLTQPLRTIDLGVLPGSGETSWPIQLPALLPLGQVVVAQASVVDASGTGLTQSSSLILK